MSKSIMKAFQKLSKWGTKAFRAVWRNKRQVAKVSAFGVVSAYAKSLFVAAKELASSPWTVALVATIALYLLINLFLKLKNRHV